MSVLVGAATAAATCRVSVGGLTAPSQASAEGYTAITFQEEFDDTSGIDVGDDRTPGFNWYLFKPFGFGVLQSNEYSVANSVLTINQVNGSDASYGLGSTCGTGFPTFTGFTAENGAYFECNMAMPASGSSGWPAWWSMSTDHLWEGVDVDFWEPDFFEKLGTSGQWQVAVHDWSGIGTHANITFQTINLGGDFNDFHTYGMLWVPGNRYAFYQDDVLVHTMTFTSFPWLSGGDAKQWPLIIGGGASWQMHVDWVRVWQAP